MFFATSHSLLMQKHLQMNQTGLLSKHSIEGTTKIESKKKKRAQRAPVKCVTAGHHRGDNTHPSTSDNSSTEAKPCKMQHPFAGSHFTSRSNQQRNNPSPRLEIKQGRCLRCLRIYTWALFCTNSEQPQPCEPKHWPWEDIGQSGHTPAAVPLLNASNSTSLYISSP